MEENCLFNKYRLYSLNEYFDGQLMIGGAYFSDQNNVDDNIGDLIIFQIGCDIDEKTNMEGLLDKQVIKHFTAHDLTYQSDEDPPAIKVSNATINGGGESLIVAVISQCSQPLTFKSENRLLKEGYDFQFGNVVVNAPDKDDLNLPFVEAF